MEHTEVRAETTGILYFGFRIFHFVTVGDSHGA